MPAIEMPAHFVINDNMIIKPSEHPEAVEVVRGPNIKPFPLGHALEASYTGKVVLKTEDNITTDHILPAGAKLLPYRSNVPYYSNYCFINVDPEFPARCREQGGGIIIGGANYGQGSSREHAALVPLYLGVKAVPVSYTHLDVYKRQVQRVTVYPNGEINIKWNFRDEIRSAEEAI